VLLKEQSLVKKTLKTASKSGSKRQSNACTNYAPLERMVLRTERDRKKTNIQTPCFRTYNRHALYDLPQALYGDRARRAHQKSVIHFSIQRIVFPTEKFGLIDRRAVSQQ